MNDKNFINAYDDDNIPEVDLPQHNSNKSDNFVPLTDFLNVSKMAISNKNTDNSAGIVEPLPESSRPRKDGPGGN